ncbi:DBR1-domain-containing protein [Zopfia rhizophila CBS 207.26]|uniref:DBR1-domain-containing protein n=1 Tax=Zopfia rhizophila CBS 207.26 TaxID=1314779 RepID=A0A6A6EFZ8_9PEZI|nr:DBR1-domain-containing protein [Zopfia rhizophila CBS 207.26]
METALIQEQGLRIAVEGCGHGTLHAIYASIAKSCELKGWDGVDLLIIGGDFQSVRNAHDLKAVAMPEKYREMCDFHEYYSGARTAPYLTIFVGGNHEASNYLWELYYGGWVAPKMYYMGAANVIRLGPLRIAGLSGIWKGYDYKKPHYERLPYNDADTRSIFHVRELDTRKLIQIRSQVDIGISHDWPRGMEWKGNHRQLFKFKPYFEQEAKDSTLGSVAAKTVMERLRPAHWFSAHMHAKYAAVWEHEDGPSSLVPEPRNSAPATIAKNEEEIDLGMDDDVEVANPNNDAEIDLDTDDDDALTVTTSEAKDQVTTSDQKGTNGASSEVPQEIRDLLPESFARPSTDTATPPPSLPFPAEITNKTTRFLALDKCLPNRHFLQLVEIEPLAPKCFQRPLQLEYDKEWLAITRVFANELQLGDPDAQVPANKGDAYYRPLIEREVEWVEENIIKVGKMMIPEDFQQTAPVFDPSTGIRVNGQPQEYTNPHTQTFCDLLQIPNAFHASAQEREQMMQKGPRPNAPRSERGGGRGGMRGGYRGGNRDRGRGRGGRGRGGFSSNNVPLGRGRGRGR